MRLFIQVIIHKNDFHKPQFTRQFTNYGDRFLPQISPKYTGTRPFHLKKPQICSENDKTAITIQNCKLEGRKGKLQQQPPDNAVNLKISFL